jgi:iron complex outermembrane receptor protein
LNNGFDDFALDNNGYRTPTATSPGRDEQAPWRPACAAPTWAGTGARLTTVTGGSWVDSTYSYDDDWTAASYRGFSDLRRDRSVFNQELRLDSTPPATRSAGSTAGPSAPFFSRTDEDSAYTNTDPGNIRGLARATTRRPAALFGQIAHASPRARAWSSGCGGSGRSRGRRHRTRFRTARAPSIRW